MEDLNNKVDNDGATGDGILPAIEWNQLATEIQSIITSVGTSLSSGDLTQLGDALASFAQGRTFWGTDTGSGTAYVVATVNTTHPGVGLFTGMTIKFRPATNNTGAAPTVAVNGLAATDIIREDGSALVAGDLSTSRDAEIRYDGTDFRLLDRSRGLVISGLYPLGYIHGLTVEQSGADTDHDYIMLLGQAADSLGEYNLDLASFYTKQIDVAWAAGSGGGLPSALTLTADTWYRVFVIGGTGATTDWGWDTSAIATNLLNDAGVNFTRARQVAWMLTDGAANIIPFSQDTDDPSRFEFETHVAQASGNTPPSTRLIATVSAPPASIGIIRAHARHTNLGATVDAAWDVRPVDMTDVAPSAIHNILRMYYFDHYDETKILNVRVSAASTIAHRWTFIVGTSAVENQWELTAIGFIYNRGRE